MSISEILKSQYCASLEMLKQAVEKCPDTLWTDDSYKNKYWHLAYHALFFTHLYLQDDLEHFTPWLKHRENYQFLGKMPYPPFKEPKTDKPYRKDEVLEYLSFCVNEVGIKLNLTDLEKESGFQWLPFNKFELQLYNIRHLEHHTGQLFERLRTQPDIELKWIAKIN
jgi:hypothetical protein